MAVCDKPADWYDGCRRRLQEMARLELNWDSYGAAPVDDVAMQYADWLLRQISTVQGIEAPVLTATPNGQVGLSWDDGQRTMDIEIDSRGRISFFYERGTTEIEQVTSDGNEIVELLSRV